MCTQPLLPARCYSFSNVSWFDSTSVSDAIIVLATIERDLTRPLLVYIISTNFVNVTTMLVHCSK